MTPATLLLLAAVQAAPPGFVPDARFSLALYCTPTCEDSVLESIESGLASIEEKRRLPGEALRPTRLMGIMRADEFGRPDLASLGALADGLTVEGEALLSTSEEILLASFASPKPAALETLQLAYGAFSEAALAGGGIVEEVDTARLFDAVNFADHSAAVRSSAFDTSLVFIIEPVEEEDGLSLSTMGLRALGLHELVMEGVPEDQLADMAAVMNALAQVTFEGAGLQAVTALSEGSIRQQQARRRAVGIAGTINASYAAPRLGITDNPLARVSFSGRLDAPPLESDLSVYGFIEEQPEPEPAAVSAPEEALEAGGALEPAAASVPTAAPEPAVVSVPTAVSEPTAAPDPAVAPVAPLPAPVATQPGGLEEALVRAAEDLAGPIKSRYLTGLPAGSKLYVKAPFSADNGSLEYLWVHVQGWDNTDITGVIVSEPSWVSSVQQGQHTSVAQEAVYDYLLRSADGSSEGNGTQAFLD